MDARTFVQRCEHIAAVSQGSDRPLVAEA